MKTLNKITLILDIIMFAFWSAWGLGILITGADIDAFDYGVMWGILLLMTCGKINMDAYMCQKDREE